MSRRPENAQIRRQRLIIDTDSSSGGGGGGAGGCFELDGELEALCAGQLSPGAVSVEDILGNALSIPGLGGATIGYSAPFMDADIS